MKANRLFLILAASLIFTTACKDDGDGSDVDITGKNNQEVMMIQPWKLYKYTQIDEGAPTLDMMDECMKDDVYRFATKTTCKITTNAKKCYDGQPDVEETDWSMTSPTSDEVNMSGIFYATFKIDSKTNTAVKMSRTYLDRDGSTIVEELEFRAAN